MSIGVLHTGILIQPAAPFDVLLPSPGAVRPRPLLPRFPIPPAGRNRRPSRGRIAASLAACGPQRRDPTNVEQRLHFGCERPGHGACEVARSGAVKLASRRDGEHSPSRLRCRPVEREQLTLADRALRGGTRRRAARVHCTEAARGPVNVGDVSCSTPRAALHLGRSALFLWCAVPAGRVRVSPARRNRTPSEEN